MGRFIWHHHDGMSDIAYKYRFAGQPSEGGEVLELLCPDYVSRFHGDNSEIIRIENCPEMREELRKRLPHTSGDQQRMLVVIYELLKVQPDELVELESEF